jgi:hypothetical protein
MDPASPPNRHPLSTLRQLLRPRSSAECCELCGAAVADEHPHLLEPDRRRLLCCCDACAILFDGQSSARYRRVPRRVEFWEDMCLTQAQWEELRLPIDLAFFVPGTPEGRVRAFYPSPAGATESLLPLEAWHALVAENPVLRELEPDVEALLVNRVGPQEWYRAPIDECYRLVGLIRAHWRGLSGGPEVWGQVRRFFAGLKARARPWGGEPRAGPELHRRSG